jgi:hypothetical protein
LHRDPSHFPKISVYHGEMRRRLWATVLEITAQSSLDMGMPPMVSINDYDTKPPANINDEDMGEGIEAPLDAKPETVFTDSSIQIGFTRTLPVRLEIIKLINNLRFDLSYDDVLRVGSELTSACRKGMIFFKAALAAGHNITPFQIKMCDPSPTLRPLSSPPILLKSIQKPTLSLLKKDMFGHLVSNLRAGDGQRA